MKRLSFLLFAMIAVLFGCSNSSGPPPDAQTQAQRLCIADALMAPTANGSLGGSLTNAAACQ
jgi:hypothetical protein